MTAVLDASALLALLRREAGSDVVAQLLPDGRVSAVNWSEVRQKLAQHGADPKNADYLLVLGLVVEAFTVEDASITASLFTKTKSCGLSLADRACLALATRLDCEAITADKAWSALDLSVSVRLIR